MNNTLPLHVLLSQLLVAFTTEHDNEWEARYWLNSNPAPVRTSLVMWANFLRFVTIDGVKVAELSRNAGYPIGKIHPDLAGMLRWGYVNINSKNPKKPTLNDIVRLTKIGELSAGVWQPLVDEIEDRWMIRFGHDNVSKLKQILASIVAAFDRPLPHYFPCLDHRNGMHVLVPDQPECKPPDKLALPYLLSQVHHLFSINAEQLSDISLAIRSNVLRVLDLEPVAKKALPRLSGISKEAFSMSITHLKKGNFVIEKPSPTARGKVVMLTEQGKLEKQKYPEVIGSVEQSWQARVSSKQFTDLKSTLQAFVSHKEGQKSQLFQGLVPSSPNLWRANVPEPFVLPHHPMVLYRGGWPDGS